MAIVIENLCKSFGEKKVLDNFELVVQKGITCIMGASGAGKTTLVNILAGLTKPDGGKITMPDGAKFSFVFQEDRLLEHETALTNLLFVTKEPKANEKRAKALLIQAGLKDSIHKKAKTLSGGMKRRVAIARALIAQSDIIILDEPFKGLDAAIKPSIMDMVMEYAKDKYTIIITHDPAEAQYIGSKTITLPTYII